MITQGHPVAVTCVYPGGIRTRIVANGRFAAGQDASATIRAFDTKIARTSPEPAAATILHGVQRGRARVLVGPDAHLVSWFVTATGTRYQQIQPRLLRATRSRNG